MNPENDLNLEPKPVYGMAEGDPYHPARPMWTEGVHYNFVSGSHELLLVFKDLTAAEVAAVRSGTAQFGLIVQAPLIVLLFRFEESAGGSIGWGEAPYNYWMNPPDGRVRPVGLEALTENSRVPLFIHLVDAPTGILRVRRLITFSPGFSRALLAAIHDQTGTTTTQAQYNRAIDRLYAKYQNSNDLLLHPGGVLRCIGGE